ncbi:MAG: hypothetical protein IKF07_07675 [Eubacterium sp.]|nr:hypothetical protein [Eubacterium sp.]
MSNFNAANFYAECKDLFGQYAAALGYAKNGIDEVADLKPRREIFVATLLGDKSLSEACNNDPKIYYYNVIRYCLTAGIEYGAQWQVKPEGFEEKGYDEILYKNNVGRRSTDITSNICESPEAWRQFLIGLHRVWSSQMAPYLSGSNAEATKEQSEAVLQSCFAVFQLGVAIALEKFDAPDEAAETADAEAADAEAADAEAADTDSVDAEAADAKDADVEA